VTEAQDEGEEKGRFAGATDGVTASGWYRDQVEHGAAIATQR